MNDMSFDSLCVKTADISAGRIAGKVTASRFLDRSQYELEE